MSAVTHPEFEAKLEAQEASSDAKVESIRSLIDNFFIREEERDKALNLRFSHIDARMDELAHEMKDVKQGLSTQRYWMVGTGIATLLGVAALNVSGMSNVLAAFESGNAVSTAIHRNAHDIERLRSEAIDRVIPLSNQP